MELLIQYMFEVTQLYEKCMHSNKSLPLRDKFLCYREQSLSIDITNENVIQLSHEANVERGMDENKCKLY